MDFGAFKAIAFRRDGKVLHATLNRPVSLNAIDDDMDRDLARLFGDVAADAETNVLVLTGAGRAFSAGGDIEHMQRLIDQPNLFLDGMAAAKRIVFSLLDCPKPVIAKVNGAAVGLGATIALFSDLIYAADTAKFGDPHVKVGYVAGDGGAVIWPQLIGYARAKEYLLTGDLLPADQLDAAVDEIAQRLANGASRAIQWTKLSVNTTLKQVAQQVMDTSLAYEALSNLTKDHQEAVNAFREKRAPRFTGE
jgi:enoyl-CoA hydratase